MKNLGKYLLFITGVLIVFLGLILIFEFEVHDSFKEEFNFIKDDSSSLSLNSEEDINPEQETTDVNKNFTFYRDIAFNSLNITLDIYNMFIPK